MCCETRPVSSTCPHSGSAALQASVYLTRLILVTAHGFTTASALTTTGTSSYTSSTSHSASSSTIGSSTIVRASFSSVSHAPTDAQLDFSNIDPTISDECNILAPALCRVVNADAFTLFLACWVTLQLVWVTMLLFVQFLQVSRAMTTYENMFGMDHKSIASLNSAFTSTGAPLDPRQNPPPGAASHGDAAGGHGHAHGHKHKGFLKQWGQLLGVDAFMKTATGPKNQRKRKNPYSGGCLTNCRDFWCDPAPVFGRRETGAAVLAGHAVNYTEMYERPTLMEITGARGRRTGGYEAVAGEEV